MPITTNQAIETVLRAALERNLAGKAVGFSFQMRRGAEILANVHEGWGRAPWESTLPGVPTSAGQRQHLASASKPFALAAVACVIDDWARVVADSAFRFQPLPDQPVPGLSDADCIAIATRLSAPPARRFVTPDFVRRVSGSRTTIDFSTPFAPLLWPPFSRVLMFQPTLGTGVGAITIDQLVLHQSGLVTDALDGLGDENSDVFSPAAFLNLLLPRAIDHSRDGYNNWNYTLLRLLAEGLSGISYSEYVHKRILVPCGARRVSLDLRDDPPESRALSYAPNFAGLSDPDFAGLSAGNEPPNAYYCNGGAGGFWASVDDLNTWLQDLLSTGSNIFPGTGGADNPMRAKVVQRFMGIMNGQDPPDGPWYGFQRKEGGALGFNCCVGMAPEQQISAALLVNNQDVDAAGVFIGALSALAPVITPPAPWAADTHVRIVNPLGLGTVRYVIGTTEPTASSPAYDPHNPFTVTAGADLRAAVFDGTQMVSSVAAASAPNAGAMMPSVPGPATHRAGVAYKLIKNATGVQKIGDAIPAMLEALVVTGTRTGTNTDINLGFPNTETANFVVVYGAWLNVPQDGFYDFTIKSDDGSRVYLDGNVVLDDDGLHGPDQTIPATVGLRQGLHRILCIYFQGGGGTTLQMTWGPHGGTLAALGPALVTD